MMMTTSQQRRVRDAIATIRELGLGAADLVALLGVSEAWATRARAAGLPRRPDGRHDPAEALRWIRARDRERVPVAAAADESSPELERWRRARADLAELELGIRRDELVDRAAVAQQGARQVLLVRTALGSIARKAGRRLLNAPTADWIEQQLLDDVYRV